MLLDLLFSGAKAGTKAGKWAFESYRDSSFRKSSPKIFRSPKRRKTRRRHH